MNQQILSAISLIIIGWGFGILSTIHLMNWAGNKVSYWKHFFTICSNECLMAISCALDKHLEEKENEFRE